eukprot:403363756
MGKHSLDSSSDSDSDKDDKKKKHKKDKKKKKHKKDKKKKDKKSKQSSEPKVKKESSSTKLKPERTREQIQFTKDVREMFQKFSANIEFDKSAYQPIQDDFGPTPTLRDQINSGSILREMYHKPKQVAPTGKTVQDYDNNEFMKNVSARKKELFKEIQGISESVEGSERNSNQTQRQSNFNDGTERILLSYTEEESKRENPELSKLSISGLGSEIMKPKRKPPIKATEEDMPLSFRERLLQNSAAPVVGTILNQIKQREEEMRMKDEKMRHKDRNHSQKLSYCATAAQLLQQHKHKQALTEEESFQRKLQIAINKKKKEKKEQRRQEKLVRENEAMEEKMRKIQNSRLKRKRRAEYKMRQKEAMRNRRNLEGEISMQYNERGRKIEEGYLNTLQQMAKESAELRRKERNEESEEGSE